MSPASDCPPRKRLSPPKLPDAADIEWLSDGASGKRINENLRKALYLCETHQADGIVVAKMDRLCRSVACAADIMNAAQTQGWALVMDFGLNLGTPTGRLMAQMLAMFAEWEREMISTRTKERPGPQHQAARAQAASARGNRAPHRP